MAEPIGQGLYAALEVLPTRGLIDYMQSLPPELGSKMNPNNAHVSLTYAYEMVVAGAKDIDVAELEGAQEDLTQILEELELDGEAIMPADEQLVPFKRFWVVPIEPSPPLTRAHQVISGFVKQRFDLDIANWRDDYHLSVARRPAGKGRNAKTHHVPFSNGFVLEGRKVEVNDVMDIPPHLLCMSRAIRAQRDFAMA